MTARAALAGVLFLATCGAGAEGRSESLTLSFHAGGSERRMVEGVVTAMSADGRGEPVVRAISCPSNGSCPLELALPSGNAWILSVNVPGYWSRGPVPAGTPSVDLYPAARLSGTATFPAGTPLPDSITVRFERADETGGPFDGANGGAGGESACPLTEGSFTCEVPAGVLDFSLRARGHVSVYRWGQAVPSGERFDLGAVAFNPGASLVGRVTSSDPAAPSPASCRVSLAPSAGSPGLPPTAAALPSVTVNQRGFFHLEAIPPGRWDVVVQQPGFARSRQAVTILEGAEAKLGRPIVLSRPVRLELVLVPPRDPDGSPWRVQVTELTDDGVARNSTAASPAASTGTWVVEGVGAEGRYLVKVLTGAGQRWWTDDVPFSPGVMPTKRRIELGVEEVSGHVTLGGSPVRGEVVFGRERQGISVAIRSNEKGELAGFLPRLGTWAVAVRAEDPTIRRELDVEVRRGTDGRGAVEIDLQDRAIRGELVDEQGDPVPKAILTVLAASRQEQVQHNVEGGAFRLDGFEPGSYLLSAEASGLTSDGIRTTVLEEGEPSAVRIVLRKKNTLRVRVVSRENVGLVGAAVWLVQEISSGKSSYMKQTDTDGRAWFTVSPTLQRQCLAIAAPRYPLRLLALPLSDEEQVVEAVAGGGTLVLEAPPPSVRGNPVIRHGGCAVPPGFLAVILRRPGKVLENLEPGSYELCLRSGTAPPDPGTCTQGWLAPFGKLSLEVSQPARTN